MKIQIVYNDRFETSSQILISKLTEHKEYELIDFGQTMRENIDSKTKLGTKIQSYIDQGQLIPVEIVNELMSNRIKESQTNKILLKNYPKSKGQIDLFIEFCTTNDIAIECAWHMVSLNVLINLEKIPKHSKMAAKYKSHDYIKMNWKRSNGANKESLAEIGKYCKTIVFESESYGINYKNDQKRINNHT